MDSRPSFKFLRRELRRHGLPARYVKRVLGELEDHQQDLEEQGTTVVADVGRCLGDPHQLVRTIVGEYQARTFCGRHPLLAFLAAPIPVTIFVWVGFFVLFCLVGSLLQVLLETEMKRGALNWPPFLLWSLLTFHYASLVVPPAATAALFCRWAYRSGKGRWSWVACALIAFLAGSIFFSFRLSSVPGESSLGMDSLFVMPFLVHAPDFLLAKQLIQTAAPLVVAALYLRKWRQLERYFGCAAG
jgi:hypothetical protein